MAHVAGDAGSGTTVSESSDASIPTHGTMPRSYGESPYSATVRSVADSRLGGRAVRAGPGSNSSVPHSIRSKSQ